MAAFQSTEVFLYSAFGAEAGLRLSTHEAACGHVLSLCGSSRPLQAPEKFGERTRRDACEGVGSWYVPYAAVQVTLATSEYHTAALKY